MNSNTLRGLFNCSLISELSKGILKAQVLKEMTVLVFLILLMKKKNLGTQKTWMIQMKMRVCFKHGTKLMTHDPLVYYCRGSSCVNLV